MRRLWRPLLPLVAAVLFLPATAWAQTGSIAGIVRDTSGGALPGVTVEVTSPALIEKVRSTVSDTTGRYQITALPVGTYAVTFTLQGFSVLRRENIQITSDFAANVNPQMQVGNVKETVDVVAEAPTVDVLNARVQHVFQGDDVAELPTQRDISSLLLLVPAVSSDPTAGICSGGVGIFCNPTGPRFNTHVSALDGDGQNQGRLLVDGMTINRGASAGGINLNTGLANGIVIDTANVQEVAFTLSGALGESETGGAAINIVPRTGGNRFSGQYFTSYTSQRFFDRNRDTRLSDSEAGVEAYVKDYDVNGAFGGPVLRDRFWFYLQARTRGNETYPNAGGEPGFANLNEGVFAANYQPDRERGRMTFGNEYKNASVRLTLQATQRNKFNLYWDEQDACTNPCSGMINIVDSPESYFSLQNRPNRLMQLSWTNPFTNRLLFDAGISVIATHQDTTRHRDFPNYRHIPRVCEAGSTAGLDDVADRVNSAVTTNANSLAAPGTCSIFNTMISGSINDQFPGGIHTLTNDDAYRSKASASYITGSHNAKIGFEGAYFAQKVRNEVNDFRLTYHYTTPPASCVDDFDPVTNPWACGNMNLHYANTDPFNLNLRRPRPVGFQMNTGVGTTDERVWFGALYLQDQWTINRLTLNGAVRYDHAESRYGSSCIGPDRFVPMDAEQPTGQWCSEPSKGARFNDITPRWGVAWDVFGTGKTAVKWNMGKYLQAAGLGGIYTDNNPARRSTNNLTRAWDDVNGNRLVECNFTDPNPHTHPSGDICGTMLNTFGSQIGQPTTAWQQFGRPPNASQLFNANSICGRTENSSELHQNYCAAANQNLLAGWDTRRNEWQFGLGVQHEVLPRLSAEVTYNRRKYSNLTDSDTIGIGCDYFVVDPGDTQANVPSDPNACFNNYLNFQGVNHDFYSVTAPQDPRLPNGGGYVIRGNDDQNVAGNLTSFGNVTVLRKELEYTWNGVDTNFVYRGPGGFRVSGGTSTGRSLRDTCFVDGDTPNVKGREGNLYGGGCIVNNPYQTNIRGNASYTIPWVDVLVGAVYQFRPGAQLSADLDVTPGDVTWEPGDLDRATRVCPAGPPGPAGDITGCFYGGFTNGAQDSDTVDLLDAGDDFGEGIHLWDLNFMKNIRIANKRFAFGVNVFNLFNSDYATGYEDEYTAFFVNGQWVEDDPSTTEVERNEWRDITQIVNPRFVRFTVEVNF